MILGIDTFREVKLKIFTLSLILLTVPFDFGWFIML